MNIQDPQITKALTVLETVPGGSTVRFHLQFGEWTHVEGNNEHGDSILTQLGKSKRPHSQVGAALRDFVDAARQRGCLTNALDNPSRDPGQRNWPDVELSLTIPKTGLHAPKVLRII